MEQINAGDSKGWVQYLMEKDLSDEPSSAVEDGWLHLSVKIALLSSEDFGNALPPSLKEPPTLHLPKIDHHTKVEHRGTNRFRRNAITWITLWQRELDRPMKSVISTD